MLGEIRATSAFADADGDDIEGASYAQSSRFCRHTTTEKGLFNYSFRYCNSIKLYIGSSDGSKQVVAQSFQDGDSAEDSAEYIDDAFGAYLINKNVLGRFQNEFLLNKSPRFTKCICRSKEDSWRK